MKPKGFLKILIISLLFMAVNCDFIMDIEPPEVQITSPEEGSYISDKVEIVVQLSDNKVVKKVELYADDTLLTTIENEPFSYQWQRFMDCSTHTLQAKAFDGAGNWRESNLVTVKSLPALVSTYNTPYSIREIYQSNNYLCFATEKGLRIIDVSNPSVPFEVASCDTELNMHDVYVSGSYAYVTGHDLLKIIDISNPLNPIITGVCSLYHFVDSRIFVNGQYAYISCWFGTSDYNYPLQIVNISNPSNPIIIGFLHEYDSDFNDIFVVGNYAYVLESYTMYSSLRIIDVSNPSALSTVATLDLSHHSYDIFIDGEFAYTENEIIDISNSQSPQLKSEFNSINSDGEDIYVVGDYAYLPYAYGLKIVDVSNKVTPVLMGEIRDESWLWTYSHIIVSIPYAFVAGGYAELNIVRIFP